MKKIELVLTLVLLLSAVVAGIQIVNLGTAQTSTIITIKADGNVDGTDKIKRDGNVYTLTGNISGSIQVQKSNIIIDGAGFTLQGNNGTGIALPNGVEQHPSDSEVWNVTVKNLRITNCRWCIHCVFGGNHTFYGNYISNDFITRNETGNFSWGTLGIALWGSSGNNITHCTIGGSPAIYMHFACRDNVVTENNIVFGAHLAISGNETFDRNYWIDYLERYPNVSEVDSSGSWNIPYVIVDYQAESLAFQDKHPLMNPLAIPNFSSILPAVQSVPCPSSIMLVAALVIVGAITIAVGVFIYIKKCKR